MIKDELEQLRKERDTWEREYRRLERKYELSQADLRKALRQPREETAGEKIATIFGVPAPLLIGQRLLNDRVEVEALRIRHLAAFIAHVKQVSQRSVSVLGTLRRRFFGLFRWRLQRDQVHTPQTLQALEQRFLIRTGPTQGYLAQGHPVWDRCGDDGTSDCI